VLTGGTSGDTFIIAVGDSRNTNALTLDRITDFTAGSDRIIITGNVSGGGSEAINLGSVTPDTNGIYTIGAGVTNSVNIQLQNGGSPVITSTLVSSVQLGNGAAANTALGTTPTPATLGTGVSHILGSYADYVTFVDNTATTVSGGAGADTIIAGNGADSIDGGTGADAITLGTGSVDTVRISSFSGDVITGFTSGTDLLDVKTSLIVNGTTTSASQVLLANVAAWNASTAAVGANDYAIEINAAAGVAGSVDTAAEVAALLTGAQTNITVGDSVLLILDDGTDTYIWNWADTALTTGFVDASELTLVARLVGVTDVVAADIPVSP